MPLPMPSTRNAPVINDLAAHLCLSRAAAAAIVDNCHEDRQPLAPDDLLPLTAELTAILDLLEAASCVS